MKRFRVAGVLGGLGPEATLSLYREILRKTKANRDQDNIPLIIINNPQIADRSSFILNQTEDPCPEIIETAQRLEKAGADFIVMPCNTAHYFTEQIQKSILIPFINMINLTADYISKNFNSVEKVGLLITTGSRATGIYSEALKKQGIEPILPNKKSQEDVMNAVYAGVKAGDKKQAKQIFEAVSKELINAGAEIIIMGCTEVPLALKQKDIDVPLIDPIDILAEKTVKESRGY